MNKFFSLIIILLSIYGNSQTNRFIYELKYRNDSTQDYRTNLMALDINQKETKFYDYDFVEYDSINKNNLNGMSSRYSTKTDQVLVRNRESNQNFWYRDFFDYFVIKTDDEIKWKLLPEKQNYNGYELQKATANFGGRVWNAWFSKEIDLKEGPYKFCGLPGLIFIVEDTNKDFVYKLVKNVIEKGEGCNFFLGLHM